MRHRQEVLNVRLADYLAAMGLVAQPEVLWNAPGSRLQMPDVIVSFRGLRTAIEGDFDDRPDVEQAVAEQAIARVTSSVAHVGVGVLYPPHLRSNPGGLEDSRIRFAVFHESQTQWSFGTGRPRDLADALRRLHEDLGREDLLDKAVALLRIGIDAFAGSIGPLPGVTERFAVELGIHEDEIDALTEDQRASVRRIAALIVSNALIFQEVLAGQNRSVANLNQTLTGGNVVGRLIDTWTYIINRINYYPIYHVAIALLQCIAQRPDVTNALRGLIDNALRLLEYRAWLRHDLMGRIYHRLLAEAKHLGAFYTSIPAATLLAKLALRGDEWEGADWSSLEALNGLRIGDLACGSGTLLMAAAEAVTDNYVYACYRNQQAPDLSLLHVALLSKVLWGIDVLPSALHLTASTLALRDPTVTVQELNLVSAPLGGQNARLGSLELIGGSPLTADTSLFSYAAGTVRESGSGPREVEVTVP